MSASNTAVDRLEILRSKLEADGEYVRANTCAVAIDAINALKRPWIDGPYGEIWIGVHRVNGKWEEVTPGSSEIVASCRNDKERALIVRAVNSHDALVKALERLDAIWTAEFPGGPDQPENTNNQLLSFVRARLSDETIEVWRQIRAALASAREVQP